MPGKVLVSNIQASLKSAELNFVGVPKTLQVDPRTGRWECIFCGASNSDHGLHEQGLKVRPCTLSVLA